MSCVSTGWPGASRMMGLRRMMMGGPFWMRSTYTYMHTLVLLSHSMQVFYICIYGVFYLENFRVLFFTHNKVSFAEIH